MFVEGRLRLSFKAGRRMAQTLGPSWRQAGNLSPVARAIALQAATGCRLFEG